jgi:hypothetical protein
MLKNNPKKINKQTNKHTHTHTHTLVALWVSCKKLMLEVAVLYSIVPQEDSNKAGDKLT